MAAVGKATDRAERYWRRPGRNSRTKTLHEAREHEIKSQNPNEWKQKRKNDNDETVTITGRREQEHSSQAVGDEPEFRDAENGALAQWGKGLSQGPHGTLRHFTMAVDSRVVVEC